MKQPAAQLEHTARPVANCDRLSDLKFSHSLPYAFTEQGGARRSSILNSERAIDVNIHIIRVFARLRKLMKLRPPTKLRPLIGFHLHPGEE